MKKVDFLLIFGLCALLSIFIYLVVISEHFKKHEHFVNEPVNINALKANESSNKPVNNLYRQVMEALSGKKTDGFRNKNVFKGRELFKGRESHKDVQN